MTKTKTSSLLLPRKKRHLIIFGLTKMLKFSHSSSTFSDHQSMISKLMIYISIPQHRYTLCPLRSRRLSTDTFTVNFSALSSSSASRLLRQHAQPQSSATQSSELARYSHFTSGIGTASSKSSDVQIAFLSGNLFSEV